MKSIKIFIAVAVLALLSFFAQDVLAQIRTGSYSLSPFAGEYAFDNSELLENGPVYGLGLGYNYTEHFGVEAVFGSIETEMERLDEDVDSYIYRIDGLYHFMPKKKLVPYLALGAGAITKDPDHGDSDTDALVNYGAGIKYFLTDNFALRGDVRQIVLFDDVGVNMAYTFGLTYLFGGRAEPVPAPPLDSDGDGVINDMDQCPGTPAGVPVDNVGCPKDSDRDGVYDYLDKCPGTPEGIRVDSVGCPVPIKEKVSIELLVEFDTDKVYIRTKYHDILKKVANFLKAYPDTKAVIEGHTDSRAPDKYNLNLSERRARSVVHYLVNTFNIEQSRLSAIGYGESRPVADNSTREGRQRNRRVVAVISTIIIK